MLFAGGVWADKLEENANIIKGYISINKISFLITEYGMYNDMSLFFFKKADGSSRKDLYRPAPSVSRTQKLLNDASKEMFNPFSQEVYSDYLKYASSFTSHCAAIHFIMDEHYPLKGVPYIDRSIFVYVTQPIVLSTGMFEHPDYNLNTTNFFGNLLELVRQYQDWLLQTVEIEGSREQGNLRIKVEDSDFMLESRSVCIKSAEYQSPEEEHYRNLWN